MTVIAFAGPSLGPERRAAYDGIAWMPPAQAGDLLCLPRRAPLTLCLIDGFFDHRPAVRHKEILLLLAEGVRILGASSIGALRAAEMARFGMMGVGAIYRAYASGRITGDDEVALAHGPEEWDWRPLSLPMVDCRATLCRAVRSGTIGGDGARRLFVAAAAIDYDARSWALVLERAECRVAGLADWLSANAVAQKTIDALACLEKALRPAPPPAPRPDAVNTLFLRALARERGCSLDRRG